MMISNEQLSAYIDGELAPAEMERVRAAVQSDELLAARLRKFEQVDSALAAFAGGIDAAPLPRALRERLGMDEAAPAAGRGRRAWRLPLALAASVLVAVFAGLRLQAPQTAAPGFDELAQVGPVPSASPLAHALERLPSASTEMTGGADALRITPQLSFVSATAGVCREFRLDGSGRAARGVACRGDAGWQTLRVAEAAAQDVGTDRFETAAGDADAGFEAWVDSLLDAAPLGAEEEARLMQEGWRAR